MTADNNVFPYRLRNGDGSATVYTGLTVQDYIAIQAMTALLTKTNDTDDVADVAYECADAMIKRGKEMTKEGDN